MPRILQAIADTSTSEIEAGGFLLRVRKIRSADLAEVGVAALHANVPTSDGDAPELAMKNVSPEQVKTLAKYSEAVVCASLIAIGDPDTGDWDDVRLVIDPSRQDPEKGVLWVGSLPPVIVSSAFGEAMRITTNNEEAADRLASFRPGARAIVTD
tara:strand:+ start:342 stop:806 length:465 start_codon:yes stop_codon:yes gene_type:complete